MDERNDSLLNNTFFNFLLGFVIILAIGMGVIFSVNYYELTLSEVTQAAATLLFDPFGE